MDTIDFKHLCDSSVIICDRNNNTISIYDHENDNIVCLSIDLAVLIAKTVEVLEAVDKDKDKNKDKNKDEFATASPVKRSDSLNIESYHTNDNRSKPDTNIDNSNTNPNTVSYDLSLPLPKGKIIVKTEVCIDCIYRKHCKYFTTGYHKVYDPCKILTSNMRSDIETCNLLYIFKVIDK